MRPEKASTQHGPLVTENACLFTWEEESMKENLHHATHLTGEHGRADVMTHSLRTGDTLQSVVLATLMWDPHFNLQYPWKSQGWCHVLLSSGERDISEVHWPASLANQWTPGPSEPAQNEKVSFQGAALEVEAHLWHVPQTHTLSVKFNAGSLERSETWGQWWPHLSEGDCKQELSETTDLECSEGRKFGEQTPKPVSRGWGWGLNGKKAGEFYMTVSRVESLSWTGN